MAVVDGVQTSRGVMAQANKGDGAVTQQPRRDGGVKAAPVNTRPRHFDTRQMKESFMTWLHDTRTERAARSAALMLVIYASAYYPYRDPEVWGLVVILVHLTISYFPVVSMGQALAPATGCAWGTILGCLTISPVVLVASYGSTATWAALMLLIVGMEPIMNNQDPLVVSLTFAFAMVAMDNILLRSFEQLNGQPLSSNIAMLREMWTAQDGSIRSYATSSALTVLLPLTVYLIPPFRSTSTLNRKLIHKALTGAAARLEKLAELLEAQAECKGIIEGVEALRKECWTELSALRKLPVLLKTVDMEPTVVPLSGRHTSLEHWRPLLSQLRVSLHRIVDVTFILEKRGCDKATGSGTALDDVAELRLLCTLVRDNAGCLMDVAKALHPGGYFLWHRKKAATHLAGETTRDNAWVGVTAQLQALVRLKQVMNLHHLASLESRNSPAGHQSLRHTRLRLTTAASLKKISASGAQQQQRHQQQSALEAAAFDQMNRVLDAYKIDATIAACVRLLAPGHFSLPITSAAAAAIDAEGKRSGWTGVRRNLLSWVATPAVQVVEAYRHLRQRFASPRVWWFGKGRHFVRIMSGLVILYGLTMWSTTYRNFTTPGHFAGWQVHAFVITQQRNVEATVKKGLLRLTGAIFGGIIGVALACLLLPSWANLLAVVLIEAAIVWVIPAPPFTKYSTSIDYDYFLQCTGITINLIMISKLEDRREILLVAAGRVSAQMVGIVTAIIISCVVLPQSGYTKARELTANAVQRAGKLLPRIAAVYYGDQMAEEALGASLRRSISRSNVPNLLHESMRLQHRRASSVDIPSMSSSDIPRHGSVPSFQAQPPRGTPPLPPLDRLSAASKLSSTESSGRPLIRQRSLQHLIGVIAPAVLSRLSPSYPHPHSHNGHHPSELEQTAMGRHSDSGASLDVSSGETATEGRRSHSGSGSELDGMRIVIDYPAMHERAGSVAGSEASSRCLLGNGTLEARIELSDWGVEGGEEVAEVEMVEVNCGMEVPVVITSEALLHFQEWVWKEGDGLRHDHEGEPPVVEEEGEKADTTRPLDVNELQKEVQACVQVMDSAYAQLSIANKYGQKWSKYIPALGCDPSILPAMRKAEELLATLRSICDIIAAERSLLFGPYAHKHSAALCPSGMPAFLAAPSTLRGAYNFAKYGRRRWQSLSEALNMLAYQVRRRHPLQMFAWTRRDVQPPPATDWPSLREGILQQRREQLEAYTEAWLGLARLYAASRHQRLCDDIPGYSPPDVLRLHVVMFHISELQQILISALDVEADK